MNTTPEVNTHLKAAASPARVLLVGPVQVSSEDLAAVADECGAAGFVGAPFTSEMLVQEATRVRSASESDAAGWRASLAGAA